MNLGSKWKLKKIHIIAIIFCILSIMGNTMLLIRYINFDSSSSLRSTDIRYRIPFEENEKFLINIQQISEQDSGVHIRLENTYILYIETLKKYPKTSYRIEYTFLQFGRNIYIFLHDVVSPGGGGSAFSRATATIEFSIPLGVNSIFISSPTANFLYVFSH